MQIAQCHLQLSSSSSPPYDSSPLPYLPSDSSNSFKIHFTLFSSTFANISLLALLALQPTCFFSDSTPAHTRCRCWAALRSPLQSRRDPCPFISAFSSTFFVFSMSHLPLLRLCLSVNIASWPPFIILQTLAPRIVFLAVLSPQFSGVDMSSSSTTQSVSWTSAPDQELNQAPQVCNSHQPLSFTLSAQTLLSSPLPTFTAQDNLLFSRKPIGSLAFSLGWAACLSSVSLSYIFSCSFDCPLSHCSLDTPPSPSWTWHFGQASN